MQVPRHWRMKTQRYRLTGVRYNNGEVSLIERQPSKQSKSEQQPTVASVKPSAA